MMRIIFPQQWIGFARRELLFLFESMSLLLLPHDRLMSACLCISVQVDGYTSIVVVVVLDQILSNTEIS